MYCRVDSGGDAAAYSMDKKFPADNLALSMTPLLQTKDNVFQSLSYIATISDNPHS